MKSAIQNNNNPKNFQFQYPLHHAETFRTDVLMTI